MFVIINYGVGNLTSIKNMLKKVGVEAVISGRKEDIGKATKLMLPGMGHFDNCMQQFNESGIRPLIEKKVLEEKIPVLGICVGLQMLMRSSEEGKEVGLNWIDGETIRFRQHKLLAGQKIPNMGWLEVSGKKKSSLLDGLEDARFYFAHSFHVQINNMDHELLTAHYGYDFTAAIERDNILGVQFHPEKSHRFGMRLLENFVKFY
jgi:imidazole glycerol-phosphate synthase subunit HisH